MHKFTNKSHVPIHIPLIRFNTCYNSNIEGMKHENTKIDKALKKEQLLHHLKKEIIAMAKYVYPVICPPPPGQSLEKPALPFVTINLILSQFSEFTQNIPTNALI